ncbi:hypothetical protein E4T66_10320 [Sinimarinibacterium sp. CAU 1509]|nr:hypothetical protein E4T66_10320 [Sinimarinibacterium sp. CAU 1509]
MNKNLNLAIGAVMALGAFSAPSLAADVGVSINAGQPGFYGVIDLGDAPRPRVYYSQPVIVEHERVRQEPIYLHVRPGESRHWNRHCHEYNACDRRVYFVNHDWYDQVYVSHYRQRHQDERGDGRRDHGDGDHHERDDRGDGHGNKGHGNDNDNGSGNGSNKRHD